MTIMVIIITIRANHWSFQGENYPSVTCLSPGRAPKCPYYHHQGHSMCVSLYACVCGCLYMTNPLTPYHTVLSASQRCTESLCIHWDNRARIGTPQGAAAASFHSVTGLSVQPEDIVCQCGAQLAYLLRPALNEPAVNGLETLAAVSGTARAGVCV